VVFKEKKWDLLTIAITENVIKPEKHECINYIFGYNRYYPLQLCFGKDTAIFE
jgi:hypothetical protein